MALVLKESVKFKSHKINTYWDGDWQEWVVKFTKDGIYLSDADYHTNDRQDARDTAKTVLEKWEKNLPVW